MDKKLEELKRLLEIMDQLRDKCPWDKKQTNETLRTLTIEETFELSEAILEGKADEIKKELGDLLLHIVFYAKIGDEKGQFDIADVAHALNEKLIFRHPHIFSDTHVNDEEDVKRNWEKLKLKEGKRKRVLGGLPRSLPALIKAHRIQDKVRGVGFDWDHREQIWDKLDEEINELKAEVAKADQDKTEAEFGDLFFSLINAARLFGVNPENALERTNRKFMKRFNYLEEQTLLRGKNLQDMNLDEMNVIWEEAKKGDE